MAVPTIALLARESGITLPSLLELTFNDGKTRYGTSREEWKATGNFGCLTTLRP
jgi:hypothetical protein